MAAKFVTKKVSPSQAQKLLEKNNRNRRINNRLVSQYAGMMKAGKWFPDADTPIKMDTGGNLLDGQHRLLGIVESETTQELTFRYGCAPESQQHMDRGRKRSLADDFHINGYKYTTLLSAATTQIHHFLKNSSAVPKTASIDYEEAMELIKHYPMIPDYAAHISGKTQSSIYLHAVTPLVASEALVIYFLTSQTEYSDRADEFIDKILFGTEETNHPCNAFKREINRQKAAAKMRTLNRTYLYSLAFSAWNKFIAGEEVKVLKQPKSLPALAGFNPSWVPK